MTREEERDLLLRDLCARLRYGVKCHFKYGTAEDDITLKCIDDDVARFKYGWYGEFHVIIDPDYIKPYLRPMSSMTEEEQREMKRLWFDNNKAVFADPPEIRCYRFYDSNVVDWLNAHHFDYRGLIEKGLAIEVTDENNPYKQ